MRKHETEDRTRGVPLEDKQLVYDIYSEGVKLINESELSDIDKRYCLFSLKRIYDCCFSINCDYSCVTTYRIDSLFVRILRQKVKDMKTDINKAFDL